MLCVDCLVEDHVEVESIVVSSGFSLCEGHLVRFVKKSIDQTHKNARQVADAMEQFVLDNWDKMKDKEDAITKRTRSLNRDEN